MANGCRAAQLAGLSVLLWTVAALAFYAQSHSGSLIWKKRFLEGTGSYGKGKALRVQGKTTSGHIYHDQNGDVKDALGRNREAIGRGRDADEHTGSVSTRGQVKQMEPWPGGRDLGQRSKRISRHVFGKRRRKRAFHFMREWETAHQHRTTSESVAMLPVSWTALYHRLVKGEKSPRGQIESGNSIKRTLHYEQEEEDSDGRKDLRHASKLEKPMLPAPVVDCVNQTCNERPRRRRAIPIVLPLFIPLPRRRRQRRDAKDGERSYSSNVSKTVTNAMKASDITHASLTSPHSGYGEAVSSGDGPQRKMNFIDMLVNSTKSLNTKKHYSDKKPKDESFPITADIKASKTGNRPGTGKLRRTERWAHHRIHSQKDHVRVYSSSHIPSSMPVHVNGHSRVHVQVVHRPRTLPTGLQRLDSALTSIKRESERLRIKAQMLRKKLHYAMVAKALYTSQQMIRRDENEERRARTGLPFLDSDDVDEREPEMADSENEHVIQIHQKRGGDDNEGEVAESKVVLMQRKRKIGNTMGKLLKDLNDLTAKMHAYDMIEGNYRVPFQKSFDPESTPISQLLKEDVEDDDSGRVGRTEPVDDLEEITAGDRKEVGDEDKDDDEDEDEEEDEDEDDKNSEKNKESRSRRSLRNLAANLPIYYINTNGKREGDKPLKSNRPKAKISLDSNGPMVYEDVLRMPKAQILQDVDRPMVYEGVPRMPKDHQGGSKVRHETVHNSKQETQKGYLVSESKSMMKNEKNSPDNFDEPFPIKILENTINKSLHTEPSTRLALNFYFRTRTNVPPGTRATLNGKSDPDKSKPTFSTQWLRFHNCHGISIMMISNRLCLPAFCLSCLTKTMSDKCGLRWCALPVKGMSARRVHRLVTLTFLLGQFKGHLLIVHIGERPDCLKQKRRICDYLRRYMTTKHRHASASLATKCKHRAGRRERHQFHVLLTLLCESPSKSGWQSWRPHKGHRLEKGSRHIFFERVQWPAQFHSAFKRCHLLQKLLREINKMEENIKLHSMPLCLRCLNSSERLRFRFFPSLCNGKGRAPYKVRHSNRAITGKNTEKVHKLLLNPKVVSTTNDRKSESAQRIEDVTARAEGRQVIHQSHDANRKHDSNRTKSVGKRSIKDLPREPVSRAEQILTQDFKALLRLIPKSKLEARLDLKESEAAKALERESDVIKSIQRNLAQEKADEKILRKAANADVKLRQIKRKRRRRRDIDHDKEWDEQAENTNITKTDRRIQDKKRLRLMDSYEGTHELQTRSAHSVQISDGFQLPDYQELFTSNQKSNSQLSNPEEEEIIYSNAAENAMRELLRARKASLNGDHNTLQTSGHHRPGRRRTHARQTQSRNRTDTPSVFEQAYQKLARAQYLEHRIKVLTDPVGARENELEKMSREADDLLSKANQGLWMTDSSPGDVPGTGFSSVPEQPAVSKGNVKQGKIASSVVNVEVSDPNDGKQSVTFTHSKRAAIGATPDDKNTTNSLHLPGSRKKPGLERQPSQGVDSRTLADGVKSIKRIFKAKKAGIDNGKREKAIIESHSHADLKEEDSSNKEKEDENNDDEDEDTNDDEENGDDGDDDVADDNDDDREEQEDALRKSAGDGGRQGGIEVEDNGHKQEPEEIFAFLEKASIAAKLSPKEDFSWGEWSSCSTTCGVGRRFRSSLCGQGQPCAGRDASMEEELCGGQMEC